MSTVKSIKRSWAVIGLIVAAVFMVFAAMKVTGVSAQGGSVQNSEPQSSSASSSPVNKPSSLEPDDNGFTGSLLTRNVNGGNIVSSEGQFAASNLHTLPQAMGDNPDEPGFTGLMAESTVNRISSDANVSSLQLNSTNHAAAAQPDTNAYYQNGEHAIP